MGVPHIHEAMQYAIHQAGYARGGGGSGEVRDRDAIILQLQRDIKNMREEDGIRSQGLYTEIQE